MINEIVKIINENLKLDTDLKIKHEEGLSIYTNAFFRMYDLNLKNFEESFNEDVVKKVEEVTSLFKLISEAVSEEVCLLKVKITIAET
ncbi:MAG: hypothetical protein ACRCX2_22655 [Paraclostridium sp.]